MNLLDVLKNQLTSGNTMDVISNLLGENKTATSKGLDAILPTILGSVIQKGATSDGASSLLNLIKTGGHDGSVLDNIGGLLGGGDKTTGLLNTGGSLLRMFMGDKLGGVASLISGLSGLKSGSTSSLLQLAAPLVMGLIGKHSAGQSASGLSSMLAGQSDFVKAALPAGISSLLGFGGASSARASTATASTASTVSTTTDDEPSGFMKLVPWLLGAAVLAGALMAWRSCNKPDATAAATTVMDSAAKTATDAATATTGAMASAVAKVGEAMKVALPGGANLDVPRGSLEDQIVTYLQSTDSISKTKWFNFDRLLFETGKATLKPESEAQLSNAVAILKAFPKVKIKLGGYTDNVGNPDANLKLSGDRAKNVMGELVKRGIAAVRLSAEGYGEKNPAAKNDTPEGRAQNRRIAINVREK